MHATETPVRKMWVNPVDAGGRRWIMALLGEGRDQLVVYIGLVGESPADRVLATWQSGTPVDITELAVAQSASDKLRRKRKGKQDWSPRMRGSDLEPEEADGPVLNLS